MPTDQPRPAYRAAGAVPVLVTRPRAAAERLAQALGADDAARVVVSPILRIELLDIPTPPGPETALLLSSAHAVAALQRAGGARQGQRAFCVGDATAQAARAVGLNAVSAGGDAAALCAMVRDSAPPGPLVWLHGAHHRGQIAETLRAEGFEVTQATVYRQVPQALSAPARTLLQGMTPVVLPVYSPRSADLLGAACADARAPLDIVCISAAARAAWSGPAPANMTVAARPDGAAMLAALRCRIAARRSG